MSEYLKPLKEYFGFDSFHPGQEEIVRQMMLDEDVCAIMPTGAGKSLCYQLPALLKPGYSLIISPLISLMKDQVDALRERGVPAAFLNSTLTPAQQRGVLNDVAAGQLKLLYVAPERLRHSGFVSFLKGLAPDMMVIDEAHCISQWGHDFRPDYARIGEFLERLQIRQVCAFTATATPRVREDIKDVLDRPDMDIIATGFKRPNLKFQLAPCQSNADRLQELGRRLSPRQPTIIYAATRKAVDEIAAEFECIAYHAGMSDNQRREAQERFMSEECPVVVATNAFGMGIDRADIRQVIHFQMPGSLEAYYQEAGRAGRDGKPADCIMLFNYSDRFVHEFFVELNHPSEEVVRETWLLLQTIVRDTGRMDIEWTQTELCAKVPGCKAESQISAALNLLEKAGVVERGFRREHRGSLRQLLPAERLRQTYPVKTQRGMFVHCILDDAGEELLNGKAYSWEELAEISGLHIEQAKRVLRALNANEFDWTPPFAGRGVSVTRPDVLEPDIEFSELQRQKELVLGRLEDMLRYPSTWQCRQKFIVSYFGQNTEDWTCGNCDNCCANEQNTPATRKKLGQATFLPGELMRELKRLRKELAEERDIPVYRVLSNKALEGLVQHQPGDVQKALHVNGIGSFNSRYVRSFLPLIHAWAKQNPEQAAELREKQSADNSTPSGRHAPLDDTDDTPEHADDFDDLYEELRELRLRLSQNQGVPAYRVMTNQALQGLCEQRPATIAEALRVKGIGNAKAGILPEFLERIHKWRRKLAGTETD